MQESGGVEPQLGSSRDLFNDTADLPEQGDAAAEGDDFSSFAKVGKKEKRKSKKGKNKLPGDLSRHPRLDAWLRLDADGRVTLRSRRL